VTAGEVDIALISALYVKTVAVAAVAGVALLHYDAATYKSLTHVSYCVSVWQRTRYF
jgi:hypothetical protein